MAIISANSRLLARAISWSSAPSAVAAAVVAPSRSSSTIIAHAAQIHGERRRRISSGSRLAHPKRRCALLHRGGPQGFGDFDWEPAIASRIEGHEGRGGGVTAGSGARLWTTGPTTRLWSMGSD
uniref:Uncharacterized protein n=1 Tax=Arundo donax TaxID=35708 RepID=A0A0A9N1Y9_ARUDO